MNCRKDGRCQQAIDYGTEGMGACPDGKCVQPRPGLREWFGLSYASWLTMPRVLMQAMPEAWQDRMAVLLREYGDTFPNQPNLGTSVRCTGPTGRLVEAPGWLLNYQHPDTAAIDSCRGDTAPESVSSPERLHEALVRLVAVEQNAANLAKWEQLLQEVRG